MMFRPVVRVADFQRRRSLASVWLTRERFLAAARMHDVEYASVAIDGIRYLVSTSDLGVGRDVFVRRRRPELTVLGRALQAVGEGLPGPWFVDVGANIGTSALPALLRYGFDRAVCCEPGAESAALLRANAAVNGAADRVTVVEAAVSDHVGEAWLDLTTSGPGTRQVVAPGSVRDAVRVDAVTLDSLVANGVISADDAGLLWIDAQGHEPKVLAGAESLVGRGIPMVVAIRPKKLRDAGQLEELFARLAHNYERFVDLRAPNLRIAGWQPDWRPMDALDELAAGPDTTDVLVYASSARNSAGGGSSASAAHGSCSASSSTE